MRKRVAPGGGVLERGGDFVALLLVEARHLEVRREQRNDGATAALSFVFGHRKERRIVTLRSASEKQANPLAGTFDIVLG